MKQKAFWISLILGLEVVLLGALLGVILPDNPHAARASSPVEADEPVTITYWHTVGGEREAYLNLLIDEFNAANPYNITVVGEYIGNYYDLHALVIDAVQNGGFLPNVVTTYANMLADFGRYEALRFLDDYFNDPTTGIMDAEDIYPAVLENYRLKEYGNQLAGLPMARSIEVMYYNADLLAAAGLDIPLTWEEFETACISLTTDTVYGSVFGIDASRFANWLWSQGGELLSEDWNSTRFDEQAGIDSLALFQGLIQDGYARLHFDVYEEQTAFGNGQAGFTFMSSMAIPYFREAMDNGVQNAWGVTRMPADEGKEVVDSYGMGQGILHHDETSDRAAWLFIKWLAETEQTARWSALTGYFPVRISAGEHISMTEKLASDEQYAQAYSLLGLGRSEPAPRGYIPIREVITGAMTEIFVNETDVTTTLQTAADSAELILASTGPETNIVYPSGGTLTYASPLGTSTVIEFPEEALAVTTTVSYVPLEDLPTDGLAFALLPNLTFSVPVTVTIHYLDEDILGMDEASLKLYNFDWATNSWVDADPCAGYIRYPEDNILQALVCHFSDYALIDWPYQVFIPYTSK